MREFTTSAKDPIEDEVVEVPIRRNAEIDPDYVPELFHLKCSRPSPGQLGVLMASIGKGSNDVDNVAGPLNFFDSLLDEDGKRYVLDRMLDGKDPFGPEECQAIMEELITEWAGRPTQPPSASTTLPANGGPSSPAASQPSTSSASLLTGS
jgi:hypothetical protein